MAEVAQGERRGRLGALSVWIAVVTFVMAVALTVAAVSTSSTKGTLNDVVFAIFAGVIALAAPGAHIAGIVMGIIAAAKPNDRRGLGILGASLNALAIAIGVGLIYLAMQGLAAFR